MNHQQKIAKLQTFRNEAEFRIFLIDLLRRMGYDNVIHTHRYGSPEYGKDIIACLHHSIDGEEWYAFVVKQGRIQGGTVEIETIKGQIKQAFEYPYLGLKGDKIRVNKVKVVTNENFSAGAQTTISTSTELRMFSNIDYWFHDKLVPLIDKFYPDFWLPGDEFCKEYTKSVRLRVQEEFELKDLSLNIEDKKVKKLLGVFVEPILTESVVEEKKDEKGVEKIVTRKRVTLNGLISYDENLVITGEPGSGKTKLANNLALKLLDADKSAVNKIIPVKLNGKDLKDRKFEVELTISEVIKNNTPDTYSRINLKEYKKILLVDEIDFLSKEEKDTLFKNLNSYCVDGSKFILTQRKNDNIDLDADESTTKAIRIHNFNIKQVEAFILKYFEGTDRGEKFIQILKESNLFAKLPTTPLTVTLLSLLYDENGYEIPATITDIYDDFIQVLLGKLEIRSRNDLLLFHIKKRIFSNLALNMLDKKLFDMSFDNFKTEVNAFLESKGYIQQSDDELKELIENSGLLYLDNSEKVGFKQQAFVEYLSSVEIYDHARHTHYNKLLEQFNDVAWQNTAIFFAGRSKDLPNMVNDLLEKMPNESLRDFFVNAGGMGYLAQALYLTDNVERKKLIKKSLDNLVKAFYELKEVSKYPNHFFSDFSLPLIASTLNTWFIENFKSITLRVPLNEAFDELSLEYTHADVNDFDGDFKLFLIASTLMQKNINDEAAFGKLLDRKSFIKNPVLMISGDFFLRYGDLNRKTIDSDFKKKIDKQIRHHINAIQNVLNEPGYRIQIDYTLKDKD
ncbi:MAG TPA: AAA family ATPase [Flavisolibacter sp.]|nr:AAA family ATPase [Flavisolibacter sp.]